MRHHPDRDPWYQGRPVGDASVTIRMTRIENPKVPVSPL